MPAILAASCSAFNGASLSRAQQSKPQSASPAARQSDSGKQAHGWVHSHADSFPNKQPLINNGQEVVGGFAGDQVKFKHHRL